MGVDCTILDSESQSGTGGWSLSMRLLKRMNSHFEVVDVFESIQLLLGIWGPETFAARSQSKHKW